MRMPRSIFALTLMLLTCCVSRLAAQDRLSRAEALEDLRYLITALEETHPDPYSAFGGRVSFKLRAQALLEAVPEGGLTPAELYSLLRPLFGDLRDGHTYISSPPGRPSAEPRYLPARFAIATDAVYIERALPPYEGLIGYRLLGLQGETLERAAALAATVFPAENDFGAKRWLLSFLVSDRRARRVFPDVGDGLAVELEGPSGARVERRLPFSLDRAAYLGAPWVVRRWEAIEENSGPFFWQFIGDSNIAYLRVSSIVGREAFEELRAVGRQDLREQVERYYERYVHASMPEAMDEALSGVPCLSRTVGEMLTSMRERGSEHLILDLRGNGGGWSSLLTPFLLLAYGDRYFGYDFPVTFATRISPAYLALGGQTLAEFNAQLGSDYEIGDYHVTEETSLDATSSRDEYANELEVLGCGLAETFRELNGRALYTPTVLVLLDPATFSAAYHFVYRLWHLGAKIVGVPSSQAGNAFVDVTPFRLPNSGLSGSIARTAQIFFPDDEERGRVLMPDFPMMWSDFQAYEFDEHAEVRYAIDLIGAGVR
ncbi:MAG: hypothetical protein JSV86_04055 [Gemmatimonadota bacterium]|nr:MAG: hypothetical protein JSV86_04055 [Gemmatimonadota bacterium]